MSNRATIVGVEGGGTYTRAMCVDRAGHVLAYASVTGGSNPGHNADAPANVRSAIEEVLRLAGRAPEDVEGLVAGLAGLNDPEDQAWAEECTAIHGLAAPRLHVNDARIAHAGAFRSQPGVIAIAGTGTMIYGLTDQGRHIRNYDFGHYARTPARSLAYDTVFRILSGDAESADAAFVQQVLAYWQVPGIGALWETAASNVLSDQRTVNRAYSGMAPLVTGAAQDGVPLARAVCDAAVDSLSVGIRLLGMGFTATLVPVALIGSVARSQYIAEHLAGVLASRTDKQYRVVEPALSPVAGAVIMAMEQQGIALDDRLLQNLSASPHARF